MKKLNIAMICDGIIATTGGSFISSLRFAKILREKGHKVIFITSKSPGLKNVLYFNKIKTYTFPSILMPMTENQLRFSFPKVSSIKKILIKEKIDLVHILIPTPSAIQAIKAARLLKIKVIVHSHVQPENLFLNLPKFIPVKMMNKIFYKYLVWVYKKVDITICPSKFSEKLLKNVLPSLKTEVVSNGVDNLKFKRINPNSLIDKFKIKGQCKKIVFVGRLHPEKNVETLVKSLKYVKQEYPNVQAVIAGFGYMQDSLESTANKLNLKEDIIFCGKVSDNDLIKVYSLCDIFVSPSLAELEGMAILEAMSCKNPIVIADSKESAAVQFVKENGFLFEPENPRDLARKILILLKDKKLRRKMAQNSLDESRNYSINKSISNLEKIYYSALQKV